VLAALVTGEQTGVVNVATGESRSFGSIVDELKRIARFEFKVIRASRMRPVTHRHFDVQHLRDAVPGWCFALSRRACAWRFLPPSTPNHDRATHFGPNLADRNTAS
jgi:hypothetical protein